MAYRERKMKKDARIFIAGHTGLIGSAVLRRLGSDGFSNIITAPRGQLDLQDVIQVAGFFEIKRPEYVILAAGRVGGIVENQDYPADFMDENIAIQLSVLKSSRKFGVTKLILFGSSCMYPRECHQPMREETLLSGMPEPSSLPYAISKLAGVYMCMAYNKQFGGSRFISVIPNSVYGPHDNFDPQSGHVLSSLVSRFHQAKLSGANSVTLWGSGSPRREFIHADDVADACFFLLSQDVSASEFPINIGVGADISIKELAETISKVVGYKGRIEWDKTKPDGAMRKFLDGSKLRSYGWEPKVDFVEGIQNTYEWYMQHAEKK